MRTSFYIALIAASALVGAPQIAGAQTKRMDDIKKTQQDKITPDTKKNNAEGPNNSTGSSANSSTTGSAAGQNNNAGQTGGSQGSTGGSTGGGGTAGGSSN